mmetsp:Transcript_3255/g.5225  ORF Transcript_3255/g.5225 Transcript_3255/m.5225 type:complete len:126 (-) Transcript_3255:74-451(-)
MSIDSTSPEFEAYKRQLQLRAADFASLNIVADNIPTNTSSTTSNSSCMQQDDDNNTVSRPLPRISAKFGAFAQTAAPSPLRTALWPAAMAFDHASNEMVVFFTENRAVFNLQMIQAAQDFNLIEE